MALNSLDFLGLLEDVEQEFKQTVPNDIIDKCRYDLELFGKTFFPKIFTGKFCDFHKDVFDSLQDYVLNKQDLKEYFVRAAPRGHGKSQILSFLFPLWCICYGYAKNILIVSDSADQAMQFIMAIRDELEENEMLRDVYGDLTGNKTWANAKIITRNRIQVVGKGAGQKLRGIKYRHYRPDVIIVDDLENDESVETEAQRLKLLNWFQKALIPCGSINVKIIYIGTVLNYESLLNKLLTQPEYAMWDRKRYQAVIKFSSSQLWEQWEDIMKSDKYANANEKALEFFKEHRKAMLRNTEVLWADKQKDYYYDLMLTRLMNPEAFDSEYQNDPVSESQRIFKEDWFKYWEELPELRAVYIGVDPSLAKTSKADNSAITVLGKGIDNYLYVLKCDIKRRKPDKIIDDLISECITYQSKLARVGIEAMQFQYFFAQECGRRGLAHNIAIPIEPMTNIQDKELRIKGLVPFIKNGYIKFHISQKKLLDELRRFPKGSDDGMDSLKYAVDLVYPTGKNISAGFCFGTLIDNKTSPLISYDI